MGITNDLDLLTGAVIIGVIATIDAIRRRTITQQFTTTKKETTK